MISKKKPFVLAGITLIVVLILSYILPAVLISDGVSKFTGADKEHAISALTQLRHRGDWIGLNTQFKVIDIQPADTDCTKYKATIQGYTIFGIKRSTYQVTDCGITDL